MSDSHMMDGFYTCHIVWESYVPGIGRTVILDRSVHLCLAKWGVTPGGGDSSIKCPDVCVGAQAAFHVGPGWAPVGQSWAPNGPQMGPTGAHLGMLLGGS